MWLLDKEEILWLLAKEETMKKAQHTYITNFQTYQDIGPLLCLQQGIQGMTKPGCHYVSSALASTFQTIIRTVHNVHIK